MRWTALLSCLLLAGCHATVAQYATIDQATKSVTVPAGGGGLARAVKTKLAEAGWDIVVLPGPNVAIGDPTVAPGLQSGVTYQSRYLLLVESRVFDKCFNFQPAVDYDLSLVDTKTGAEVFTMAGAGCESDVAADFVAKLSK